MSRLAAELATKGSSKQTAIDLWTQVFSTATSTPSKAVTALDQLLPKDEVAREKAVAALKGSLARHVRQLVADLFQGYR